jgi:hypothetical protein
LISTTLENWSKTIADAVTASNFFLYMLKRSKVYKGIDALGERMRVPLRYQNGNADVYAGYDPVDTTPIDGVTSAFFSWKQLATSITIDGLSEAQNSGEYAMIDLLETKTNQAMDGINEKFGRAILQGNGINSATAITTAYTSPTNGRTFVDPLPLLVGNTPSSGTVGSISCSVSDNGLSWWQNQQTSSSATTFAGLLKEIRHIANLTSKGVGGAADMVLTDLATQEVYEAALRSQNQFLDISRADIPFENIAFNKKPVVWDEYMPNWAGGTTVQSTSQGTWLMLHSSFFSLQYHNAHNFAVSPFVKPENQDARTALVLWYGGLGISNRRKHGVLSGISTTITS